MSELKPELSNGGTQLLRGKISNYRRTRQTQDFMFTSADKAKLEVAVLAAGIEGLGGLAVGLAGAGMDTAESADLLEFDLDGKHIRAWVWISVFKDGDEVEVVAESMGSVWQGYGIRRPTDKIIAMHPHCSRGRRAHWLASFKWFIRFLFLILLVSYVIIGAIFIFKGGEVPHGLIVVGMLGSVAIALIYGAIAYSIANKFMGFVKLAEGIFTAFGWKDVENIDLPAITKKTKKPDDPGPLGVMYFRY